MLPVKDGVVHVVFVVCNDADIPALDGGVSLIICDACKFASEPPQFIKVPGEEEPRRLRKFEQILPKTVSQDFTADVQVPPNLDSMEFGIDYRCRNCIIPELHANMGIVYLDRRK
jgi:hypothetical protein